MSDPLHTPLCDLLGIRVPVILAGMAGGPTTPELVAAVGRAGGLGTFGASGMAADALVQAIGAARAAGAEAVSANVLLAPPRPGGDGAGVRAAVEDLSADLAPPPERTGGPADAADLVRAALDAGATSISVGLGDPAPIAPIVRAAGVPLIVMAACVADAERAVASGADVIVAQGGEAGGHRSNFEVSDDGTVPLVGTFALVPQIVDAVDVPVVAAGGIMDGRGLIAAMALGAQGVQMGTSFLVADESGIAPSYKSRVSEGRDVESVVTSAVSGRPARGLPNRLIERLERTGETAGWPAQAGITGPLRAAAHAADRGDLLALWSGQAGGMAGAERPAEQILSEIVTDARAVLDGLTPV